MIDLDNPMAEASIRWLDVSAGGRRSGPPTAPVYAATAVFKLGGEEAVHPGWPAEADQLSILVKGMAAPDNDTQMAEVGFLVPSLAQPYLKKGAELVILEGPRIVAYAVITKVVPYDK